MRRTYTLSTVIVTLVLLASSLLLAGSQMETVATDPGTRNVGQTLYVENGTITIDRASDAEMKKWDKIVFRDDGKLIIKGDLVITQEIICRADFDNTSFQMINDGEWPAKLTVQSGVLNLKADDISIQGSTISVTNESGILDNGENGKESSFSMISRRSDLVINDTSISVSGQPGASGANTNGGNGGKSFFTLRALGNHDVRISDSDIYIQGGKGGDTFSPGWGSGTGGQVLCNIEGRGINIRGSSLYAKSGSAGAAGAQSFGKTAGNCQMFIESISTDLYLSKSDLEAEAGTSSSTSVVLSQIKLTALSGALLWDEGKTGNDRLQSLSSWKADNLQTEAIDDAFLYEVDVGDSPPASLSGTHLSLFWWAQVIVNDNTKTPMENVAIRYYEPSDISTLYPKDGPAFTDTEGKVWLEVESFKDNLYLFYTFRAEDLGGASASSDRVRFNSNSNLDVYINLTTINIQRVSPPPGKRIGGDEVRFQGTAVSGGESNVVNRVVIYREDEVLGEAKSTAPQGGLAFSSWEFVWNSETVPDGIYSFSFIAFDNSYSATLTQRIEVNQTAVPHPPLMVACIVTDPIGIYSVLPGESTDVHVNQNDKLIDFEARIFDVDYRSDIIDEGKELVSADVRLVYVSSGAVILTRFIDDFQTVNESGGSKFNFQIDSSKKPGTSEALDDGLYRVEMDIKDDAGYWKESQFILFELFFDYYPNAYSFIDVVDGKRLSTDKVPGVDQIVDYEAFFIDTEKSHTAEVRFNLTRCTDQDSPKFGSGLSWQDLNFTVRVKRQGSGEAEKTILDSKASVPTVEYQFNVKDVEEGTTGNFDVWIEVTDKDGLKDEVRYMIRVTHNSPEERHSILSDLTGIEALDLIESDIMSVINPILFLIMVGLYLGLLFFMSFKYNSERKKKMELVEKKRKDDQDKKKDTSIDDEISGTYMKTSQKYLEATGVTKGKDEFAKELEAARAKDPVASGPVQTPVPGKPQGTPAKPPAMQQPGTPQPPKQVPVQQSPAPISTPKPPQTQQPPAPAQPPKVPQPVQPPVVPPTPSVPPAPVVPPVPAQPPKVPPVPPVPEK